jgi:hypothetical protein
VHLFGFITKKLQFILYLTYYGELAVAL